MSSKIEINEVFNTKMWDEYIKNFSSTPFITSIWIECFKEKKRNPIYLEFFLEGKKIALISGLSIEPKNSLFKPFYKILFFFSGPSIINNENSFIKPCLSELINFARVKHYTHINIESFDFPFDINLENLPFKHLKEKEYILDLNYDFKILKKNMPNRMTEVRAAEKNGLIFNESYSPLIIKKLLELLEKTKERRLSKKYYPYSYFYIPFLTEKVLFELFNKKILRAFYTENKGTIISVMLCAVFNNRTYALLIGTNKAGYQLKSNSFIHYKAIEKLKNEGVKFYNFGGIPNSPDAKGLAFFKTSFGAKEIICTGGRTYHLQSKLINEFSKLYTCFPEIKVKKFIRKILIGRNYT